MGRGTKDDEAKDETSFYGGEDDESEVWLNGNKKWYSPITNVC